MTTTATPRPIGDVGKIAVADRRERGNRPPQAVADRLDVPGRLVLLDRPDEDARAQGNAGHDEQCVAEVVADEHDADRMEAAHEEQGDAGGAEQPQESRRADYPQRAKERGRRPPRGR